MDIFTIVLSCAMMWWNILNYDYQWISWQFPFLASDMDLSLNLDCGIN